MIEDPLNSISPPLQQDIMEEILDYTHDDAESHDPPPSNTIDDENDEDAIEGIAKADSFMRNSSPGYDLITSRTPTPSTTISISDAPEATFESSDTCVTSPCTIPSMYPSSGLETDDPALLSANGKRKRSKRPSSTPESTSSEHSERPSKRHDSEQKEQLPVQPGPGPGTTNNEPPADCEMSLMVHDVDAFEVLHRITGSSHPANRDANMKDANSFANTLNQLHDLREDKVNLQSQLKTREREYTAQLDLRNEQFKKELEEKTSGLKAEIEAKTVELETRLTALQAELDKSKAQCTALVKLLTEAHEKAETKEKECREKKERLLGIANSF